MTLPPAFPWRCRESCALPARARPCRGCPCSLCRRARRRMARCGGDRAGARAACVLCAACSPARCLLLSAAVAPLATLQSGSKSAETGQAAANTAQSNQPAKRTSAAPPAKQQQPARPQGSAGATKPAATMPGGAGGNATTPDLEIQPLPSFKDTPACATRLRSTVTAGGGRLPCSAAPPPLPPLRGVLRWLGSPDTWQGRAPRPLHKKAAALLDADGLFGVR